MAKTHITTTINGDRTEFLCDPADSLLDVLRGPPGLTGAKEGCGSGDCGPCRVTLAGRLVLSFLLLEVDAEGNEIQHNQGMAPDAALQPAHKTFTDRRSQ